MSVSLQKVVYVHFGCVIFLISLSCWCHLDRLSIFFVCLFVCSCTHHKDWLQHMRKLKDAILKFSRTVQIVCQRFKTDDIYISFIRRKNRSQQRWHEAAGYLYLQTCKTCEYGKLPAWFRITFFDNLAHHPIIVTSSCSAASSSRLTCCCFFFFSLFVFSLPDVTHVHLLLSPLN